ISLACAFRTAQYAGADTMKNFARLLIVLLAVSFVFAVPAQVPIQPSVLEAQFKIPATDDGLPGAGPIRRYDWFQKHWQKQRMAWAFRTDADKGALVFLGDSITEGWGDKLAPAFAGVKVANRGISGDTTRGVLIRLKEDVLALEPAGVVLLIGTNDLEEKAEPEVIAANLKLR